MKKSPAKMPFSHHGLRRGTIFHYYMIYLFLTGVLMTSAGLCLHTILKADQVDSKVAIYLKTLTRLDQVFEVLRDQLDHRSELEVLDRRHRGQRAVPARLGQDTGIAFLQHPQLFEDILTLGSRLSGQVILEQNRNGRQGR